MKQKSKRKRTKFENVSLIFSSFITFLQTFPIIEKFGKLLVQTDKFIKKIEYHFYWIIRYLKNYLEFIFNKNIYYLRNDKFTEAKDWIKTIWGFLYSTIKYIGIVLLIFYILNQQVWIIHSLKNILAFLGSFLPNTNLNIELPLDPRNYIINRDSFQNYLSISIAFIGVLLGLYFTAITSVFTSAFSKADGSIKQIFIDNPKINRYSAFLAFSLGHSIVSYVAISTAIGITQLNIYFNIIISIFSVYAFFKLGNEVFSFFDIITLLNNPLENLESITKKATNSGYKYNDPNFQNYQHIQAIKEIKKIVLLKDYLLENYSDDVSKSKFLQRLNIELINYLNVYKPRIPTDSLWFEQIELHKKWFLTDVTRKEIALNSGTQLSTEKITDYDWIEKRLYPIIVSVLENITDDKTFLESILLLGRVCWTSGYFQNSTEADSLLSAIHKQANQRLIKNSSPKLQIQFGDSYAYLAINRFVGFINMINNLDSNGLSEKLAVKIINGDYEVGAENIPLPLLSKIQDISKKITFERNSCIEVSPKKFVQDQIKVALIENTLDYFEKYTVKTIDRLITETTGFIANKLYYLAAQTNLRIYECIEKSQALAERVDGLLKNNCQLEINTELLNRYKTRKKLLEIKLDEIRDIFIKVMPNIKSVDDKELPDLYGHIYHILYFDAEELLRSKKTEAFRKALKVLFGASKELLNANINEVLEINPNIESNYLNFIATQPLFDLLELSGYAKIYSELYGQEDLWTACLEEWERNKDNAPDPDKYTNLWKFVYVLKNTMYPVHERDMLRHNWEIKLRNQFIKEGVIEENIRYGYYGSPLPKHKSKLIVYLANHDLSFERGSDIFMIYLGWWDDNSLEKIDKNLIEIKNIIEKDENE